MTPHSTLGISMSLHYCSGTLCFVSKIPNLKCVPIPVVADKEPGITNSIRKVVPHASVLHCWNHIKQDFKFWLGQQQVSSDQKSVYISDLVMVLDSDTQGIFLDNCEKLTAKWSKPVMDYFNKNIRDDT